MRTIARFFGNGKFRIAVVMIVAVLAVSVFISSKAVSSPKTKPVEARFSGSITDEKLNVTIRFSGLNLMGEKTAAGVWIADLSKTPIAVAQKIEFDKSSGILKTNLPVQGWEPADRALYTLWYRLGTGENQITGAASLREVFGSMRVNLYAPSAYQVGTRGSLRVVVRDYYSGFPIKGATVKAHFEKDDLEKPVFEATTDSDGTFRVEFPVPDDLGDSATLVVSTEHAGEKINERASITFKRTQKILLTSDKPLYQPGQLIRIRSLALSQATRLPISDTSAVIEVEDSKGNKVFKKKGKTDRYGIFAADFQLASELNMGTYRLRALVGEHSAEKTVEIKRYVLPRFKVTVKPERDFYKPGATVTGFIDAQYIFGKPVAGAKINLTGYASQVGAEEFAKLEGVTGKDGRYSFEMKLPEYFVGQDVDSGLARAQLSAEVIDKADHKQQALKSVTVSSSTLNVLLVPESGSLVKGVPNRLFVMVSKPDGSPTKAKVVDPWKKDTVIDTDSLGLVTLNSPVIKDALKFDLKVFDDHGNEIVKHINLHPRQTVLLRADRPVYRVGDTATLQIISGKGATNTVYVDVINNNQTVLTTAEEIQKGRAKLTLPITTDMVGTSILHAYILDPRGNMIRDTRLIYVNAASDLNIGIRPKKDVFRPGQKAHIDFEVTDNEGHPVAAALGVTIVDEAVFALQDMQPGFEKVFFMLEKELMKPRYEIHSFTPESLVTARKMDEKRARGYGVMLASIEPALTYGISIQKVLPLTGDERNKIGEQIMADLKRINKLMKELKVAPGKEYEQFAKLDNEEREDPWGTPYSILWAAKGQIKQILCYGPDKLRNTQDDFYAQDSDVNTKSRWWKRGKRAMGKGGGGFGMARGEMMFDEILMEAAPMAGAKMDVDRMAMNKEKSELVDQESTGETSSIRVRKYFPETLYSNPALITDAKGRVGIDLEMADSITSWRIGAMANSMAGLLGSVSAPVVVFQDFFVDIDFPVALTRNDEVEVPVALYNYLKKSQTIRLSIEKADWYELLEGQRVRKIKMARGEVKSVTIKIKAKKVGRHGLTIYAKGSKLSDAVKRTVEVIPDGKKFETLFSDRIEGDVSHNFYMPANAIEGANKLFVKIYPGLMSQVIEGLDSILRMPGGCFEQTSSATYPNIMVLDYMKTTGKISPEIRMKAEGYINQGYQRLLSFEVPGGGFEWFGNAPAHKILTAYGLMEFFDMSSVHNVDPAVIKRTQNWLISQQKKDGSWEPTKRYLDTVASKFTTDVVRNTAYIAWALAKSGSKSPALQRALDYLDKNQGSVKDAYTLALIANAFANAENAGKSFDNVYDRLMNMKEAKDGAVFWPAPEKTSIGSRGMSAQIETTALVGQALVLMDRNTQAVNGIIKFLAQNKDSFGNWHSTQATVYALKVMLMSAEKAAGSVNGELSVMVNGKSAGGVAITPDNADVVKMIDATSLLKTGENRVELSFGGEGQTMYQVVARHFMPWKKSIQQEEPISIEVNYDKTTLKKDDMVTCTARVVNNRKGDFGMVVIDLGIPPGFEVQSGDLAELVGSKTISKFETTGRQVIVYLDRVVMGKPVEISYRLRAKYPVKAQTPASKVYEYYNPAVESVAEPVEVKVTD